jgi:glycosyltransferase involved in cell wall biosynthesis
MLSSALAMMWLKISNPEARVVVWVQDLYEQGVKETMKVSGVSSKIISVVEDWLLRQADQVVMAHPAFIAAKKIESTYKHKFSTIPNWSQFEFLPTEGIDVTKERYELGESKLVLHIGNMGVKQGLENVLGAARLAEMQQKKIFFLFAGGGNQLNKLLEISSGCSNVKFIAPVSDSELSNLLQAADLLLVNEKPGVKEMSIPSKLTTYFQTGNPVLVCSECDSLAGRTVLKNGIGFWVHSGTPNALLSKIDSLDLGEAKIVARKAKEYAEKNLSKESALSKFILTLQNL